MGAVRGGQNQDICGSCSQCTDLQERGTKYDSKYICQSHGVNVHALRQHGGHSRKSKFKEESQELHVGHVMNKYICIRCPTTEIE